MVKTYFSARAPNCILGYSVCVWGVGGLDIRVTLSTSSLNFIFKFVSDLHVLFCLSMLSVPVPQGKHLFPTAYLWESCITYCLYCRCTMCCANRLYCVSSANPVAFEPDLQEHPSSYDLGFACHLFVILLVFIWPLLCECGVWQLRFRFCTERSYCCIEVCVAFCVTVWVLVNK